MAKIDRYSGNLPAFASQADTNQRTTFGTTATGDDTLDGNINQPYLTGWQIVGPNESPTLQDFNAAFFTIGRLMAYVHQMGMPEWSGAQEYHVGSKVNRGGVEYVCTTAGHVSTTPPESDAANWRLPRASDIGHDSSASGITGGNVQAVLNIFGQKSLATNGYQTLPGGLILQWMQGSSNPSSVNTDLGFSNTLPITFPNGLLIASATHLGQDANTNQVISAASASSVSVKHQASVDGSATESFIFAIGF